MSVLALFYNLLVDLKIYPFYLLKGYSIHFAVATDKGLYASALTMTMPYLPYGSLARRKIAEKIAQMAKTHDPDSILIVGVARISKSMARKLAEKEL